MPNHPAEIISAVADELTAVINQSHAHGSRLGYFPALYRQVTFAVKDGVVRGDVFDDDHRMARLVRVFADRYLDALRDYQNGRRVTASWQLTFETADDWWPVVLQHLLLGINAHINLDLGIAAVQVVEPGALPALRNDFVRINETLSEQVDGLVDDLAWVWPPLRWIYRQLGSVGDTMVNFSMSIARDEAWRFAEHLATLPLDERTGAVHARDVEVERLGRRIRNPGPLLRVLVSGARLGERGSVSEIVSRLAN